MSEGSQVPTKNIGIFMNGEKDPLGIQGQVGLTLSKATLAMEIN